MSKNRSETILKCIVEYFIKHAQPVGSQTLIDEYKLNYSSATIRNEMSALEKAGYIEKTHSSSGRVPSSSGYRYYCEHLRDNSVDEKLKNSLQVVLAQKVQSIEEVIKESCEILSHMTSLVSVVIGPDEKNERLANVQLIKISDNSFTAVFVTNTGYVENKTFIVPDNIKADEIVGCVKLLNDRLIGTPINELLEKMESLKPILSEYVISHDVIYQALVEIFLRFASDRMNFYGREELFSHPEFKNDSDKLLSVLKLLKNTSVFRDVEQNDYDDRVGVRIGDIQDNPDVSVITTKVKVGDEGESTIALLGPTRMDYSKVVSALEYLSKALEDYFKDPNKGDDDNGGEA